MKINIIANGTEKQNAWASDIVNNPIKQVVESIAVAERSVERGHECDGVVIEPLRAAITMYETRLNENADTLTTRFVIENRAYFSRMMYNFVAKSLKAAGLNNQHSFCKA